MNAITHRQFFGDGERVFALPLPMIEELQRVTATGIGALAKRIFSDAYSLAELHQIIRLGLIGGGTDPKEAAALMSAYVYPRPIVEARMIAVEVLSAAYFGTEGEKAETAPVTVQTEADGTRVASLA